MKQTILILVLAAAGGALFALLDPRLGEVISALVGAGGVVYFTVSVAREGLAHPGDVRESPARPHLMGALFSAGFLLKSLGGLLGVGGVLGQTLDACSLAAVLGGLMLITSPRREARPASPTAPEADASRL